MSDEVQMVSNLKTKEAVKVSYEQFEKLLADALWKRAGKLRESPTTCAVDYRRMFERMPLLEGWSLLALAREHEEFHPEREAQIEGLLKRRTEHEV